MVLLYIHVITRLFLATWYGRSKRENAFQYIVTVYLRPCRRLGINCNCHLLAFVNKLATIWLKIKQQLNNIYSIIIISCTSSIFGQWFKIDILGKIQLATFLGDIVILCLAGESSSLSSSRRDLFVPKYCWRYFWHSNTSPWQFWCWKCRFRWPRVCKHFFKHKTLANYTSMFLYLHISQFLRCINPVSPD